MNFLSQFHLQISHWLAWHPFFYAVSLGLMASIVTLLYKEGYPEGEGSATSHCATFLLTYLAGIEPSSLLMRGHLLASCTRPGLLIMIVERLAE
jgi:hypothetical protein